MADHIACEPGTDVRLQRRARSADEGELFKQNASRLLRTVGAAVRTSPANVEDACAFAWLQLVRHQPCGGSAFAWLCKTAIHEAIKLDRRARRVQELDPLARLPVNDPRQDLGRRLEVLAAAQAIAAASLRPRERHIVSLRALGYGRHQISALTGDSVRTVDRQLGRARRKLNHARLAQAKVA